MIEFKANEGGSQGKDFLKFKSGDSHTGVFSGTLFDYKCHWINGRTEVCPDDGTCVACKTKRPAFKFRGNFIVKEGEGLVAKILEGGWELYSALGALHKDFPIDKNFIKITRTGSTMNDTSYSALPVPNGALSVEKLELVSKVKLHELVAKPTDKETPANMQNSAPPAINAEENLPF